MQPEYCAILCTRDANQYGNAGINTEIFRPIPSPVSESNTGIYINIKSLLKALKIIKKSRKNSCKNLKFFVFRLLSSILS